MNTAALAPTLRPGSQNSKILARLRRARGGWVSLPKLVEASGSYAVATRVSEINWLVYRTSRMRTKKNYPMNGPSLHIQKLMQRPRENREELRRYFKANPTMRAETVAVAYLK